jgi:hypothetical protein
LARAANFGCNGIDLQPRVQRKVMTTDIRDTSPAQAPAGTWRQSTHTSARANEVLAVVITLALITLALLAAQRLTLALLTRRRLAAWEVAWSRIGPQWSRGRP